ncbi:MAG TPA: peptidylprolyl isomerase [Terricaulis sp.]|nr:peptidylprolyl isomerase [Terricaulis sp.]
MILQFRKFSKSIFAAIILGLVGLAMVLWLPSGQFSTLVSTDLVKVGDYTVTPQQLTRDLQRQLRSRREQTGEIIAQQDAIDAGLHNQLLDALTTQLSVLAYADKVGVSASDRQVGEAIRAIPQVSNPVTGQFDQASYGAFLRQIEYGQTEFESMVRGDFTTQLLTQSLLAGARSPSSYGALMLAYQTERRTVSIAELPATAAGPVAAPTDEQIQAFYNERVSALRVPEFRVLTFAIARTEDFVARANIDPAELEQEVEANRAAAAAPERRSYVRLTAQNEAQANEIAQRLNAGEAPAAIAAALGVQTASGDQQTRADVLDEAVAEAVFSTEAGAPARVARGRLSPFVVVRVSQVIAPPPVDMAALREQVRTSMAMEQAADLLNTAIGAFEEARSAGASVADAARQHGLTALTTPPITAQGVTQQGAPLEALQSLQEPLRSAFELGEGEATDFLPFDGGDVIVSVDRVIPESVRPLEEVRDALVLGWTNRERERLLQERGAAVVQAIRDGASLADAARANRMNLVVRSQALDRREASQIPARGLANLIFQSRQGEAVSDMRADGGALLFAVVENIERTNPADAPQLVEQVRESDSRVLTNAISEALAAEIVERMRPRRNQRLIDRSFPPSSASNE